MEGGGLMLDFVGLPGLLEGASAGLAFKVSEVCGSSSGTIPASRIAKVSRMSWRAVADEMEEASSTGFRSEIKDKMRGRSRRGKSACQ
jgi:hypothetical protein